MQHAACIAMHIAMHIIGFVEVFYAYILNIYIYINRESYLYIEYFAQEYTEYQSRTLENRAQIPDAQCPMPNAQLPGCQTPNLGYIYSYMVYSSFLESGIYIRVLYSICPSYHQSKTGPMHSLLYSTVPRLALSTYLEQRTKWSQQLS